MKIREKHDQEFILEDGSRVYFTDYNEYLKTQIQRAKKTRKATINTLHRRKKIFQLIIDLKLDITSILCVGCRDKSEIDFFAEKNYKTEGIDLIGGKNIITCDMARIPLSPYFKDKQYDAVVSIESMEHCLDLKGFIEGLNQICTKYFICYTPILKRIGNWDVAMHPFCKEEGYDVELNKIFNKFQLIYSKTDTEKEDKYRRLIFILEKLEQSSG